MKFVFISDTHCQLNRVNIPEGDVLIHCGDLTYNGTLQECAKELSILRSRTENFKHRILVAGNHDWLAQKDPDTFKLLCKDNWITYLQDEEMLVNGFRIYGSPWQPEFYNWAFNVPRGQLHEKWNLIPDGLDILVTHGPPYGLLDKTYGDSGLVDRPVGCQELCDAVLKKRPKVHAFGHVHASYGQTMFDGIHFVNAATCDETYSPVNTPIVVEL